MSLIYDSDTDTVIKDTDPGDNPPPRDEDWRERGGKGTYDEANFSVPEPPPVTPPSNRRTSQIVRRAGVQPRGTMKLHWISFPRRALQARTWVMRAYGSLTTSARKRG
jgi:hypothetical protein